MSILDNYKDYRKNKPSYNDWKEERNLQEAKRIAYLRKNGIDPNAQKADIERAKAVLNAVDVMDEFSQSKAEEMEMTVETGNSWLVGISSSIGFGLAVLSTELNKNVKNAVESFQENGLKGTKSPWLLVPAIIASVPVAACIIFGSVNSAKQETKASRLARTEAMNTRLASAKQFAVLNDEQEKQVNEKAKNIEVTDKEIKSQTKVSKGFGVVGAIKTFLNKDKENIQKLNEINEQFKKDEENVNSDQTLTPEQIEEAKKDKQLIQNVVEKIDIASQEYAEDVELATTTIKTAALGTGGALGVITKFILSKAPIKPATSNKIAAILGGGIALLASVWATEVQKNASRVARFKVKQDFLNNPEKLVYVDDEKTKNEEPIETETKKKKGFIENLKEIAKNNKEYKQYQKEHQKEQIQKSKAREEIELTPEQEKRAKQLQHNVFKMFNKVDEKSQTYSESTEALGEIIGGIAEIASMLPGTLFATKSVEKILTTDKFKTKNYIMAVASFVATLLPPILLNALVTKEQKTASKVADMLAIKDLDDYKNFADYTKDETISNQQQEFQSNPTTLSPVVKDILKRRSQNNTQTTNKVG